MLAVAALLLGAEAAAATDVDPLAVRSAGRNAELNGVAGQLVAVVCDSNPAAPEPLAAAGEASGCFDVCMANILQARMLSCSHLVGCGRLCVSAML